MNAIRITANEAKNLLLAYKASSDKTKKYGVFFKRANKKCIPCGVSRPSLNKYTHCPKCGDELSEVRLMNAQFGVKNPAKGVTPPGQGAHDGESFEEALSKGRLKVYDKNAITFDKDTGKKIVGGYRQFYWHLILSLKIKGVKYDIEH